MENIGRSGKEAEKKYHIYDEMRWASVKMFPRSFRRSFQCGNVMKSRRTKCRKCIIKNVGNVSDEIRKAKNPDSERCPKRTINVEKRCRSTEGESVGYKAQQCQGMHEMFKSERSETETETEMLERFKRDLTLKPRDWYSGKVSEMLIYDDNM